jgi:hypothetical protein
MNRFRPFCAVVPFAALILCSCARHVVIDPDLVPSRNDRDWTIRAVPAAPRTSPPVATPALAPPPPAPPAGSSFVE